MSRSFLPLTVLTLTFLAAAPRARAQDWASDLYRRVRPAIVRIESADGIGSGFVLAERDLVATAFHVVETGRPLTVRTADGETRRGRAVAVDPDHDLAIVRVSTPIEVDPLALADEAALVVGTPVAAIGHPYGGPDADDSDVTRGLLNWSLTEGVISAVGPANLQTSAPLNPGNSGGPLLTRDARVVGVVSAGMGQNLGFVVRADHLAALLDEVGEQETYTGRIRFDLGFGMHLRVDSANDGGLGWGMTMSGSLVAWDSAALVSRLTATFQNQDFPDPDVFSRSRFRLGVELEAQWRHPLYLQPGLPLYLVFGLGGSLAREWTRDTRLGVDGSCTDPSCTVELNETRSDRLTLRPMGTLGVLLGNVLELSYSIEIDPAALGSPAHRFLFGVHF